MKAGNCIQCRKENVSTKTLIEGKERYMCSECFKLKMETKKQYVMKKLKKVTVQTNLNKSPTFYNVVRVKESPKRNYLILEGQKKANAIWIPSSIITAVEVRRQDIESPMTLGEQKEMLNKLLGKPTKNQDEEKDSETIKGTNTK